MKTSTHYCADALHYIVSRMSTDQQTPAQTLALLSRNPGDPPPGMVQTEAREVLGDVKSGDDIAVDGQWFRVVGAVKVNDTVEVEYASAGEVRPDPLVGRPRSISGDWRTPVFLAHICCQMPVRHPA